MPTSIEALTIPYDGGNPQNKDDLQASVRQLVIQKGPFRTITKQRLQGDFLKSRQGASSQDDEVETALHDDIHEAQETRQETRDRLFRTQAELHQALMAMNVNLSAAIDGLASSLSQKSRGAANAISPALKNSIPENSIDSRSVEERLVSKTTAERSNDISTLARSDALKKASDVLRGASDRLKLEADHQSKYWEQLAHLRSAGWPVSRTPQSDKAIVVHFGCAESNQPYRNKGLAPLQQNEEGGLALPSSLTTAGRRTIAIQIRRGSVLTGQYHLLKSSSSSMKLESDLIRAREALFQEELFTEASKEARLMANLGVEARSTSVDVKLSDDLQLTIRYGNESALPHVHSHSDDSLAHFVGESLRLMLVAEHQQKQNERSIHKPAPMTQATRPPQEYALLRPTIAQLKHQIAIGSVRDTLRGYQSVLLLAGLEFNYQTSGESGSEHISTGIQDLRRTIATTYRLSLPDGKNLTLFAETHLGPPRFGTQFSSTVYSGALCGTTELPPTSDPTDVVHFIEDFLARSVASFIVKDGVGESRSWAIANKFPIELTLSVSGTAKKTMSITFRDRVFGVRLTVKGKPEQRYIEWREEGVSVDGGGRGENEPVPEARTFRQLFPSVLAEIA